EYIDAFVKEVLRIRPVIPGVGRVVHREPFSLAGYTIPVGMEINPSIAMVHRRGDTYASPNDCRPERLPVENPPDTYTSIALAGGPSPELQPYSCSSRPAAAAGRSRPPTPAQPEARAAGFGSRAGGHPRRPARAPGRR